jgi:hypothetical protein
MASCAIFKGDRHHKLEAFSTAMNLEANGSKPSSQSRGVTQERFLDNPSVYQGAARFSNLLDTDGPHSEAFRSLDVKSVVIEKKHVLASTAEFRCRRAESGRFDLMTPSKSGFERRTASA